MSEATSCRPAFWPSRRSVGSTVATIETVYERTAIQTMIMSTGLSHSLIQSIWFSLALNDDPFAATNTPFGNAPPFRPRNEGEAVAPERDRRVRLVLDLSKRKGRAAFATRPQEHACACVPRRPVAVLGRSERTCEFSGARPFRPAGCCPHTTS